MNAGLAARLRLETADLHRRAERAGVMREMLTGKVEAAAYTALLRNLFEVYQALEDDATGCTRHPVLSELNIAAVARAPALAADLTALHGPLWERELATLPVADEYSARIRTLGTLCPLLLAAHAYVRYLGDLSGGRMLGNTVARRLGLGGRDGLAFYRFTAVPDPDRFKREFREALDSLPLDTLMEARMVEEARTAFCLNVSLFEAIARRTTASAGPARPPGG